MKSKWRSSTLGALKMSQATVDVHTAIMGKTKYMEQMNTKVKSLAHSSRREHVGQAASANVGAVRWCTVRASSLRIHLQKKKNEFGVEERGLR